jgi:hypothetical protein
MGNSDELGAIPVNGECELASGEMQPPAMNCPAYLAGTLAVGEDSFDVLNLEAFTSICFSPTGKSLNAESPS